MRAWAVPKLLLVGVVVIAAVTTMVLATACSTSGPRIAATPPSVEWRCDGFVGRHYTTDHFDIYSTLADRQFESIVPGFMEAAYRQYASAAPPCEGSADRLAVYIFGSRQEWARFSRRHHAANYDVYARIRVGGFTEGGTCVLFYVNRAQALSTLAHEGWHAYVAGRISAVMPAWLNEGFACCFEAIQFVDDEAEFTPKRNLFRINALRRSVQADHLMSLSQLVETDAGRVIVAGHDAATQRYYPQAWALVTFLRYGPHARALDRMLGDLATGDYATAVRSARVTMVDPGDVSHTDAAFFAYFGCVPADLDRNYYAHIVKLCGF